MADRRYDLIGIGLYTVPEAARLARVPAQRLRRWVKGYDYLTASGEKHHSDPVWRPIAPIDGELAVSFRDLIEARFVNAFRGAGVSWAIIRRAATEAGRMLGTPHPFATQRFKTDGKSIFGDIGNRIGAPKLLDMARNQLAFNEVISPSLFTGLEFAADELVRWRPLGGRHLVVLDPTRSFGRPILDDSSVPTAVLAAATKAEGDDDDGVRRVARWFDVPPRAVTAAIEFERSISRAAIQLAA